MKQAVIVAGAALTGFLVVPAASHAGEWGLGIGVAGQQPPQDGADRQVVALPFPSYEGERLAVGFGSIGFRLAKSEHLRFAVEGQLRFDGYDPDESPSLNGLEERDITLDAGFSVSTSQKWGVASLKVMADALGVHEGYEISASYQRPIEFDRWTIVPGITAAWSSADLVEYYYGVRTDEATPDRPAYSGGSTVNVSATVNASYRFTNHWQVIGGAQYTRLGSEITDSPIIGRDYEAMVYSAIVYRF